MLSNTVYLILLPPSAPCVSDFQLKFASFERVCALQTLMRRGV